MSFRKRRIDVTFYLGKGSFGDDGSDTVKVSGLRVSASIAKTSGPGLGELNMRVYGLTPSLLRQLSALNQGEMSARNNSVLVEAGDNVSGMSTVFEGHMLVGQILLNEAPASPLLVYAVAGALQAVQTGEPVSYPGSADAAVILADLAKKMGLQFENSQGVSVQLATPVFTGSLLEQARRCAQHADIEMVIDGKTLAIWPTGSSRAGIAPIVSPETGMVGYPSYSSGINGISVVTEFKPSLRIGGTVEIKSSLAVATGTWKTFEIGHELESEVPGGQWFTRFNASAYVQ